MPGDAQSSFSVSCLTTICSDAGFVGSKVDNRFMFYYLAPPLHSSIVCSTVRSLGPSVALHLAPDSV